MIESIHVSRYRKLHDVDINLEPTVNAISGTNGTCKTSLLHIISNAFQRVEIRDARLSDPSALRMVNRLNSLVNVKIEGLTKGDKRYNDPAPNYAGQLFTVQYGDGSTLSFRRHNYRVAGRYSVKPVYARGRGEKLPALPVVYLSLSRLFPWGEYQDDGTVKRTRVRFVDGFCEELSALYKDVTGIEATAFVPQAMGSVKTRQDFDTNVDGIDANTISSGEDNVLTLLSAFLSLKYYYASLTDEARDAAVASVLLIDEFDATLHPSFQYKLLEIAERFSAAYRIQVVFTTHSLVLLDQMFRKRMNVVYLLDERSNVVRLPDPDPLKIEMFLKEQTRSSLLSQKVIPVFSEDEQARLFFSVLFECLASSYGFMKVREHIHLIDANFGAEELGKLFKDRKVRQSSMASICVLDGDHDSNLSNNTVSLPGGDSPEWVAFDYACALAENGADPFWVSDAVLAEGYSAASFSTKVEPEIQKLRKRRDRRKAKTLFGQYERFFEVVLKAWSLDARHEEAVARFATELEKVYRKVAGYQGIYVSRDADFSSWVNRET